MKAHETDWKRKLVASAFWPKPEEVARYSDVEWRTAARIRVRALRGAYLVAMVWLGTALLLAQREEVGSKK